MYISSEIGISTWLSSFLEKNRGFPSEEASIAYTLFWIMMIPGRILTAWMSTRIKKRNLVLILIFCAFLSYTGILLLVLPPGFAPVAIGVSLIGLLFGPIYPTILGLGVGTNKGNTGSVSAFIIIFVALGYIVYPYLMGVIASGSGLGAAILLTGIPLTLLISVLLGISKYIPAFEGKDRQL
jgi:MFS transporter, FHS family, glucose/mannose:H+ symporter